MGKFADELVSELFRVADETLLEYSKSGGKPNVSDVLAKVDTRGIQDRSASHAKSELTMLAKTLTKLALAEIGVNDKDTISNSDMPKTIAALTQLSSTAASKVNGVPGAVARSLATVFTAYFDGAYGYIAQRDDLTAPDLLIDLAEDALIEGGSPTEHVQELAKEVADEAHAAGLDSMKAAMVSLAERAAQNATGVEPNRDGVIAFAGKEAAAAYDRDGLAGEISTALADAGVDDKQLHARASECVKTVMVELAKETAGVLFDAAIHLLTTTKKPTIADLRAAAKAKSDSMCADAKAKVKAQVCELANDIVTSAVGADRVEAAEQAKALAEEVLDTTPIEEPIDQVPIFGEITVRIVNKWGADQGEEDDRKNADYFDPEPAYAE